MNRQKSSRFAVVLGFLLFGSLGWVMLNSGSLREYAPEKHRERIYTVQMDIRGDLLQDQVIVQETLAHHTTEALPPEETRMANWEMNFCCEDPSLYALGEERVRVFQWWGSFAFSDAKGRGGFLASLVRAGKLEIEQIQEKSGVLMGIATAEFSVPGYYEQGKVHLQEFAFNLRLSAV